MTENRADIYKGTLEAVRGLKVDNIVQLGKSKNFLRVAGQHKDWLQILADLSVDDSRATIERKIQDMVFFMRTLALDSPSVRESLENIDDQTIHLAAVQMWNSLHGG